MRSSRRAGSLGLLSVVLLVLGLLVMPVPASADAGDVGLPGPLHTGTGTPTGTKRAESVLWFNDGSWWGNLWDTQTSDFHIFRFNGATQAWVDTGVTTETRANTHHDILWDGTTLFIASNQFVNDNVPASAGVTTLRRYSYNTSTDTYTQISSSKINDKRTETITIDKDSTGRLWATWQQDSTVYLNVTATDGKTWGTPFAAPGGSTGSDDTSSLVAFGGNRMGLMWSRQVGDATDGFYWSVHTDGDASGTWSTPKQIKSGAKSGDDHMNLKWLDSSGGRVFAAVKTSFTSGTQPLIQLFALTNGVWTQHTIAKVSECPNRVLVLIDEAAQKLRTFATYPKPSGTTNAGVCTSSGGAIYEKSVRLDTTIPADFGTAKTVRIVDADQYVHNVSSTKQNLNRSTSTGTSTANSGALIIADVNFTKQYWSYADGVGSTPPPPTDTTPPDTTITGGPSGSVTGSDASFEFTSSETDSTLECRLDSAAFAACSSPKAYTGLAAGAHTFEVRATDAAGNTDGSPASRTWTIGTGTPSGSIVRQSVSSATNATAVTTLRINSPTGVTAGDVLVSCVSLSGGTIGAGGVPAGWTQLAAAQTSITNPRVYGYYKVATAADASTASYAWTTSSNASGGSIARYSGASGLDTTATTAAGAAATSGTAPQVTTTTADAMLIGCMSVNSSSTTLTSSPSGMTQVVESGARRYELADGVQPAAGPSGTKTWAFGASRAWGGWLSALRPR